MADQYTWAIIGVCASIGACALALIIFVIIFCRIRIKEDSNVRKRIITKKAFPDERPETPQPEPEPLPLPVLLPPTPQPVLIPRPMRLPPLQPPPPPPPPPPQPQPPPPPPEPRVIIREIYRNSEDSLPALPSVERVRRRSWAGANDEWVLVKKIKRRTGHKKKVRSDDSSSSSSSSSDSSDSDDERQNNRRPKLVSRPAMVPMQRYAVPRLEPYDLAISNNNGLYGRGAPRVLNMVPVTVNPGMPSFAPVMQPTVMMPGSSGNQPGYVSVMMPQQLQ